jgi:uncharacterized protein YndB with AHSA1/START domain
MSDRSTNHTTFVVERDYPVTPARVFDAFADPVTKTRWFAGPPGWDKGDHELDFTVGGREHLTIKDDTDIVHTYDARYQDIVPNERIVNCYTMYLHGDRISVSLMTIELAATDGGTHLTFTEQVVFLDGADEPALRIAGTEALLDSLGAELTGAPAA